MVRLRHRIILFSILSSIILWVRLGGGGLGQIKRSWVGLCPGFKAPLIPSGSKWEHGRRGKVEIGKGNRMKHRIIDGMKCLID